MQLSINSFRASFLFNILKPMFNVIRLPTKFTRTIRRFSQKEKAELLDTLLDIWDWETINIPDTLVWDTVWLIYWEWMNMESKNGNKPKTSLIQYSSESVAQVNPSDTVARVEYNRVEENRIDLYKPAKQVFQEESFEYIISKQFLDFHKQEQTPSILYLINSKWEQDILNKWSDEVRKLKEIDKYTEEQIKYIINFTLKDDFWKNQIQSIDKFRKKKDWITYFVKMIDKAKENQKSVTQVVNLKSEF